ncbi:MAG TPA: glycosyltransferase family 2 protein [Longimicrobiales bacterium]|nr:glycosyltransferase family 2 protein [Longimicrobiales bacterium]
MRARVSVVIPCYRQAHFLAEALASVRCQTHPAHETVVVDDGSPDDVPGVVDRVPDVRCLRQDNRGLSAARNAGLAATSGELVVFLDADDRLLPEALEAGVDALAGRPRAALAWGFNRPIDREGRALGPISNPYDAEEAAYTALLERNVVGPPVGVVFRRTAVVSAGGFGEGARTAEDYDLYLRLAREHTLYCHRRLVGEYRHHDANMSSDAAAMLRGVLEALESQESYVEGDATLRRALARGRRNAWRRYEGSRRVARIGEAVRQGRWGAAGLWSAALLARDAPYFLSVLASRASGRRGRAGTH